MQLKKNLKDNIGFLHNNIPVDHFHTVKTYLSTDRWINQMCFMVRGMLFGF